MQMQIYKAL